MHDLTGDVKRILRDCPDARTNDCRLLLALWEMHGIRLSEEQARAAEQLCNLGSLVRTRIRIQNRYGMWQPNQQSQERR